jgi:Domain of unknown function (DUF3850)
MSGKIHFVKSWPKLFEAVLSGEKTHDIRKSDRTFVVGDRMCLQEFNPETKMYTGQKQFVRITYITSTEFPCALSASGLNPQYCVLSISKIESI